MFGKRMDLAIINRDFWPRNQIIGEALLCLAEKAELHGEVCVITQSSENLKSQLVNAQRGHGIKLQCCRSLTDSASSLLLRIIDAIWFMTWCAISLVISRPRCIYVSTNPPVLVPFIVFLYAKVFNARYFYHVQDIHPEATNIVVPVNRLLFFILKGMDSMTLRHATGVMTLSDDMQRTIIERSVSPSRMTIVDNPAVFDDEMVRPERQGDVVFCGNAGRLQRIPLLLEAIRHYYRQGGTMRFTFAGGGVYADTIRSLANEMQGVSYLGLLPAAEASRLVFAHRWALLPIDDEVTRYAFPSKSSCYLVAGCQILAICSRDTSVARWVAEKSCGLVAEPDMDAVVAALFSMEKTPVEEENREHAYHSDYSIARHVDRLFSIMNLGSAGSRATQLDRDVV